ncbi:MAG: NAD-dependent malic enzyme [Xanthomonadales bacterium]|nr:NAD-dependent malic enzyme [Xanthomonadales bacterium]
MGKRSHDQTGYFRLIDPVLNKSTGFTEEERDRHHLRGLLPPRQFTLEQQKKRVLANLRRKESPIEKYIYLQGLQDRNETLFFRTVVDHIEEIMPLIYTPTVGQACREFAAIFRRPRGLYVTAEDRGRIAGILANWPETDVRIIVVTDGERILGLGDLGANGMGIPVGKLALYVACAGIEPSHCLPIQLDVGTENAALREDPLYLGLQRARLRGEDYDSLVDELMQACQEVFPGVLVQFEDFVTPNAYKLLGRYRDRILCFNDDIQGTAAVALAGVYAATRISGVPFRDQKILFLGAGSAATGIADLIVPALVREGRSEAEARQRLWFCNSQGLLTASSERIADHNRPYAHDAPSMTFLEALDFVKPTALIGATGRPGTFTEEALKKMASINEQPVIFALSNPTSNAECTAQEAYEWTGGRAVFASGSPFGMVEFDGQSFRPGQGNNAYIFPGIGLGAIACGARHLNDNMFMAASQALAEAVTEDSLARGAIYPPLPDIRRVSLAIAVAVAQQAVADGEAEVDCSDWHGKIEAMMYDPKY